MSKMNPSIDELIRKCQQKHQRYSKYCLNCGSYKICWEFESEVSLITGLTLLENTYLEDYAGNLTLIKMKC